MKALVVETFKSRILFNLFLIEHLNLYRSGAVVKVSMKFYQRRFRSLERDLLRGDRDLKKRKLKLKKKNIKNYKPWTISSPRSIMIGILWIWARTFSRFFTETNIWSALYRKWKRTFSLSSISSPFSTFLISLLFCRFCHFVGLLTKLLCLFDSCF